MLAQKNRPRSDDQEFDVASPSRLLTFLGGALLVAS